MLTKTVENNGELFNSHLDEHWGTESPCFMWKKITVKIEACNILGTWAHSLKGVAVLTLGMRTLSENIASKCMSSFSVPYVCSTLQMGKLRHKEWSLAYDCEAMSKSTNSLSCALAYWITLELISQHIFFLQLQKNYSVRSLLSNLKTTENIALPIAGKSNY